jgi:hypothetical protein
VSQKFVESILRAFRNDEVLIKKPLGFAQPFLRKDHGLRLVDRVVDEASFMESVQHIPVEALPCAVSVMQGQPEKGQGDFVNCYGLMNYRVGARSAAGSMTPLSPRLNVREHRFQMHHYRGCARNPLSRGFEPLSFAYFSLRQAKKSRCRPAQGQR